MLDSGNQAFLTPWTSFYSKSQHSYQIWWHLIKKWRNSISFSKFKMATAAILDSSHQAFFDSIHVLAFKVSTFIPNVVKFGKNWKNGISFIKFKMAVAAMFDSGKRAFLDAMDKFVFKVATFLPIWWNLVKKCRYSISFYKLKMAVAAMLVSGNRALFDNHSCVVI